MMAPPPRASQRLRRLAGHVVRSGAQHEADLARLGDLIPELWEQSRNDPNEEVIESPWHSVPLFDASKQPGGLTAEQKRVMDEDGHIVLPGILTEDSIQRLIDRLGAMNALNDRFEAEKAVKRAALERERDAAVTAEEAAAAERALDSWAAEDGSLGMRLSVSACASPSTTSTSSRASATRKCWVSPARSSATTYASTTAAARPNAAAATTRIRGRTVKW